MRNKTYWMAFGTFVLGIGAGMLTGRAKMPAAVELAVRDVWCERFQERIHMAHRIRTGKSEELLADLQNAFEPNVDQLRRYAAGPGLEQRFQWDLVRYYQSSGQAPPRGMVAWLAGAPATRPPGARIE